MLPIGTVKRRKPKPEDPLDTEEFYIDPNVSDVRDSETRYHLGTISSFGDTPDVDTANPYGESDKTGVKGEQSYSQHTIFRDPEPGEIPEFVGWEPMDEKGDDQTVEWGATINDGVYFRDDWSYSYDPITKAKFEVFTANGIKYIKYEYSRFGAGEGKVKGTSTLEEFLESEDKSVLPDQLLANEADIVSEANNESKPSDSSGSTSSYYQAGNPANSSSTSNSSQKSESSEPNWGFHKTHF